MPRTPTQHQLDFVRDIEDAVIDLIQRNVKVKHNYQVTDQAGREVHDLTNVVNRLLEGENWDLIARLAEAYLKVGLAPSCLVRALEASPQSKAIPTAKQLNELGGSYIDSQPLKLERSLPSVPSVPKPQTVNAEVLPAESEDREIQTLTTVLTMLKRLPLPERRRVADQAYRYVGMGE